MKNFLTIASCLIPCFLSSSQYDAERTKQLRAVVANLTDTNSAQQRNEIKRLLEARANPNEKDSNGSTPLHIVFYKAFINPQNTMQNAAILLWYGANGTLKDRWGKTPFETVKYASLAPQAQALPLAVAHVKAQHKEKYTKEFEGPVGPAGSVVTHHEPSWGEHCWSDINAHMT